ncbi:hypothetical protein JFU58_09495 [Pseudomonas sp. TH34]|uniref:hypothetical protein n=1 Tax=Pseudomonas sp. TH34 TaxID=2796399 RepID=UPI00191478D1|nr:hypothetical protein [Pseudomonas sp. TH34]MBK5408776.1 hypothetical protein [Pseudomonas sp. TH34]
MKAGLLIAVLLMLGGCVTNQLHFASYTSDAELASIKNSAVQSDIVGVSGYERCGPCTERSKIVWHAANHEIVSLYEGMANVPVDDWVGFTKRAIGSDSTSSIKTRVEIDRVFVKTWSDPEYYATDVELSVYIGGVKYAGHSLIKIKGAGQTLIQRDKVAFNSATLDAVSVGLKAAYLDAFAKFKTSTH